MNMNMNNMNPNQQNQQNQNNPQMHQNMQTGSVPPKFNHGGHEVFDVKEVLTGAIGTLDLYTMCKQYVKDPELQDILQRQYQFILDEYNITLECFQTGKDPSKPTQSYQMKQGNDFIFGLKPTQPTKPVQSQNEINDASASGFMLSSLKSMASAKTLAALESTNPVVRRVLADSIPNCIEMAYELSIYQNKHHYYQVPQMNTNDVQQIMNSFAPVQGNNQMLQ
ncbi:spore coat protein CotF [Bacillus chungangensis]|uniref:Spore coat protein CotF n=2 Tax=Bacillus chungangensis TaxID=587633 RepID=A0ABT9WPV4_9BACI|nr:spore coat protein CotF [Bacillus chungangensis]